MRDMVSITCPCAECEYNGARYKCKAKKIKLKFRNMATVNEGRVNMWICDKYTLSAESKKIAEAFETMIKAETDTGGRK